MAYSHTTGPGGCDPRQRERLPCSIPLRIMHHFCYLCKPIWRAGRLLLSGRDAFLDCSRLSQLAESHHTYSRSQFSRPSSKKSRFSTRYMARASFAHLRQSRIHHSFVTSWNSARLELPFSTNASLLLMCPSFSRSFPLVESYNIETYISTRWSSEILKLMHASLTSLGPRSLVSDAGSSDRTALPSLVTPGVRCTFM